MSKKARRILIAAAVVILTVGWFWRYTTLNAFYDSIKLDRGYKCYNIGDIVPFQYGYSIRVDSFELVDYTDIDPEAFDQSTTAKNGYPGKFGLLHITLFNKDNEEQGIMLNNMNLYGIDQIANVDWQLLKAMNPVLKGNYGVRLSPAQSCLWSSPMPSTRICSQSPGGI